VNLLTALRRTTDDGLPTQTSDEDLLAWAEELKTTDERQPRRRRPLVAAPAE
jgi:hypothetical protein